MILQFVKLKSDLSEEELLNTALDRKPQFEEIPGLLQKYYVKIDDSGRYGGMYIWDSKESMLAFRETELAKSIPQAYKVVEAPEIEILDILFQLRD